VAHFSSDGAHTFYLLAGIFHKEWCNEIFIIEDLKMLWNSVLPSNPLPKDGFRVH